MCNNVICPRFLLLLLFSYDDDGGDVGRTKCSVMRVHSVVSISALLIANDTM
jgi:hypothetical protein